MEYDKDSQESLPDMEVKDIILNMSSEERAEEKRRLLEEMSDRESLVHLINRIEEG